MAGSDYERDLLRGVIQRICELEGLSNEVDVAGPLGVNPRNVAAWKSRKSVPWLHLEGYCQAKGLSMEWMLYGRGARKSSDLQMEPGAIYRVTTDQDAVYRISAVVHRLCRELGNEVDDATFSGVVRLLHRERIDNPELELSAGKIEALIQLVVRNGG
ncbi:helix-turn-helix domain-containing protein [Endothiovibrio diazotrophicus]